MYNLIIKNYKRFDIFDKNVWYRFNYRYEQMFILSLKNISGSQTACIAVVCRALLEEKTAAELVKYDVDELIDAGDRYYRQCMLAMKCYKGGIFFFIIRSSNLLC